MSQYDYIQYDETSTARQKLFKTIFENLSRSIDELGMMRSTAHAQAKLEEAYMWIGKAIRDEQIKRAREYHLQEDRNNA